ncbi:MAG: SiaB family protein kinase [Microscillaceae bacterium]
MIAQEFSLFDYYTLTKHNNILVSYKGPITDLLMAEIVKDIRLKMADNPQAGKKLFAVIIELAQNILYYSAEVVRFGDREDRVGTILITDEPNQIILACGNLVENDYIETLAQDCHYINTLDREGLREYKRTQRSRPRGVRSRGAGIGLIQAALTSDQPLRIETRSIDPQFTFFSLSVAIRK